MRRSVAALTVALLCATFAIAGCHDHVSNDPLHPEHCSECALASVYSAVASEALTFDHPPTTENAVAEAAAPKTGWRALDRSAPRAPPACC